MRTYFLLCVVAAGPLTLGPAVARAEHHHHSSSGAKRGSHAAAGGRHHRREPPAKAARTPDEALRDGIAAFEAGDYATAIPALQEHTAAAKPAALAYLLLGRALVHTGKYEDARVALSQFLKVDAKSDQADAAAKLLKDCDVLEQTRFEIGSTPPGASFALDAPDGPAATAPGVLHAPPGSHKLFVQLAGYETATVDATVEAGEAAAVNVPLQIIGCDLHADVLVPATSATMRVDDGGTEATPGPVRIAPGKHRVEIASAGGDTTTKDVTCNQTEPLAVSFAVPAPTQGRLAIQVPVGGRLLVDGKERESQNGRALVDLSAGEHLVDVEAEGKVPWHAAAIVHTGETTELTPGLEEGGGATGVEITPHPANAKLTVDGKPVAAGEVARVKPGKHAIVARAAGYFPTERTVEIIKGERAHVEVRLEQRGRFLLYMGLGAIPIGLAAEGLALVGHFNAAGELSGSPTYERWHALELSGHIIAGVGAAVAVAGITGYFLQQRSEGEAPKAPSTVVGAAPLPGGASVVVARSF